MKKTILFGALALAVAVPALVPEVASARDRNGRVYRGDDRRYETRCHRTDGKTGLIAGGVGGAVAGNVLGGGLLGTVAGGVGGALLGKHIDKRSTRASNRRKGC
ncbi:hypothetical protein WG907_11345 [Sphingobium sp. AN558]|uniref:hypothetical protein n=1 Tax=Sphingobium sp. AN558 TaxID=3133442 RepID=UPI0030BEC63E